MMKRCLLLLLAAVGSTVNAAEWTVTCTADNGPGTLRESVSWANITPGADTVVFDQSLDGQPVVLTGATIAISDDLTITGLGVHSTIIRRDETAPPFRIFDIDDGSDNEIDVMVQHLTISNGHAYCLSTNCDDAIGGGIRNAEHLTVYSAAIVDNTAEYESIFPGCCGGMARGGGIFSSGPLEIRNTTVAGNTADGGVDYDSYAYGGGVFAADTTLIQRSTFSGNTAQGRGWSVKAGGGGFEGYGWIRNSTFSGNIASAWAIEFTSDYESAAGGGISGAVTIHNSTITGNTAVVSGNAFISVPSRGGGLEAKGASTIVSTIAHGNTSDEGSDVHSSGWVAATDNLVGNPTDSGITIGVAGNISADPLLGSLQNLGGHTKVHPLYPSSPAIDQGSNELGLATDQRGYARVVNETADIGAYEYDGGTSVVFFDGFENGSTSMWSEAVSGF